MRKRCIVVGILGMAVISACGLTNKTTDSMKSIEEVEVPNQVQPRLQH